MAAKYVTAEEFIRAYQASSSVIEAASKLNVTEQTVYARAAAYRKKGIQLKRFPNKSRGNKLDVQALNALIKSL